MMSPEEFYDLYVQMIAEDVSLLSPKQRQKGIQIIRDGIEKIKKKKDTLNLSEFYNYSNITDFIQVINNVSDNISSDMSCNGDYWGAVSNAGADIPDDRLVTMCAVFYQAQHESNPQEDHPFFHNMEYWSKTVKETRHANINNVYEAYLWACAQF